MRARSFFLLLTGWTAAGCGGEAFQAGEPPAPADASADVSSEASSPEAASEAAIDAKSDAAIPDQAAPDVSPDVGPDATPDVLPDALPDVAPDSPEPDAGCTTGETIACYEGPADTEGKGGCKAGLRNCDSGAWGSCIGQVLPTVEVCNALDDDCNGVKDDAIATPSCYTGPDDTAGKGLCKAGSLTCVSGQQICANQVLPSEEVCGNNIDENCDGEDEACAVCAEIQPVVFPSTCGASCANPSTTSEDADCDGMIAGDPSPNCNTLLFFDGFKDQPDATKWTLGETTTWQCGWLKLQPSSGTAAISDPSTSPSADNIIEARVKLGPAVAGDFRVGIKSAVTGSLYRTCEIWTSATYTAGKPGIHLVVSGTGGSSGAWSQPPFVLDASAGKTYILRLSGKGANTTCQILSQDGATLLHTLSSGAGGSFQPGSISVYATTREAHVDYLSVYSW